MGGSRRPRSYVKRRKKRIKQLWAKNKKLTMRQTLMLRTCQATKNSALEKTMTMQKSQLLAARRKSSIHSAGAQRRPGKQMQAVAKLLISTRPRRRVRVAAKAKVKVAAKEAKEESQGPV